MAKSPNNRVNAAGAAKVHHKNCRPHEDSGTPSERTRALGLFYAERAVRDERGRDAGKTVSNNDNTSGVTVMA
jgi:hypothetical protein